MKGLGNLSLLQIGMGKSQIRFTEKFYVFRLLTGLTTI